MTDDPSTTMSAAGGEGSPDDEQSAALPESEVSSSAGAPGEPERQIVAVAYIGGLDDCHDVITALNEAGISASLNVADLTRPDLRARGYYLVTVAPGLQDKAREVVEAGFREEFNLAAPAAETEGMTCPACGTTLAVDAASCPDCGLNFT